MQHDGPLLSARNIAKVYGQGDTAVHALRGVNLDIDEGEMIVILGPSGSGKSTLLNILGGLDRPSAGEVAFEGAQLTAFDDRALTHYRRNNVGFVFQFYNLIPSLTARENVALVTDIAPSPMKIEDALDLVDLTPRAHHFPAQLSGGEQQRVAIARAIAKRPRVLLCDEPTGALDSKTGIKVLEALVAVADNQKTTTLIITHNVSIADLADRVLIFGDGRLVEERRNKTRKSPQEMVW